MFGKQLRQRNKELEIKLEQAATYTDNSTFDCPLCKGITATNPIPKSYCSLHQQIGELERTNREMAESHKKELDEVVKITSVVMEISNEHRRAIDNIMLVVMKSPFNLSPKQTEILGALASSSELKIQALTRTINLKKEWMHELKYPDKT